MKQILQSYRSGELWLAEVPTAACKSNGVLVRTRHSLVSAGTERMLVSLAKKSLLGKARARPDLVRKVLKRIKSEGLAPTLEKVFAKLDEPITLGYSATGEVIEAGRQAVGFRPGDRVALAGAGYATHAEFNYVPNNLCARVPDAVSDPDAAFATVGAIALQGVRQTEPRLGERVVVIGLGLIGLLTVQMLKANGCAVLGVDLDDSKVARAKELGADVAVSNEAAAACEAFTQGRGADAVIVTAASSSSGPVQLAAEISRQKGRVVVVGLVGMDLPRDAFYLKELDLRLSMSYGPGRYDPAYEESGRDYPFAYVRFTLQRNMESFLYLVEQGRVTPSRLVTHRFAFDDALSAYQLLSGQGPDRSEDYLGIVLDYPTDARIDRTVAGRDPVESRAQATKDGTVGVGFVGAGGFARGVLLPELGKQRAVRLTAVCTTTGTTAHQTAARCGFSLATTDYATLLDHARTDAVFVVTTHASHARLACEALRHGKHVFVEKPLCLHETELTEYEEALAQARAAGHSPCLMVGFNRRFSPHTALLKREFAGRGTPMTVSYRVNAGRIPPEHWVQDPEIGGGRILGECCHFVDVCGHLVASPPVRVFASSIGSDRRDVVARDSVVIVINYADGSLATVSYFAEGHADMPKERCEVFADGESAVMENYRSTQFFGSSKGLRGGKQAKGFAEEITAFVDTVRSGGAWPIEWTSLVQTQRVCWAALRSLETGEAVELPSA
ncbi:MAG: zinc-binding dehydrogenase [Myxococcales bacterium FL481]|nr:MAG: zinc-binding dehydrogenase [Myxococcales bacterium FL481]